MSLNACVNRKFDAHHASLEAGALFTHVVEGSKCADIGLYFCLKEGLYELWLATGMLSRSEPFPALG